jgi:hypothetical protein
MHFFIKKIEMVNNCYQVPRIMDVISAIEITGKFENQNRMSEIYNKIKWIEIEIGGEIITRIYLENNIYEIISNNYFYTIHIPLDKILYNTGFIPVISLPYHDIKIHIKYYGQVNFDFYLLNITSLKI